ncbi:acetyltransferase [Desulfovibrio cuneatus]|uniref:acetyltransferase n=1 Tax=Desulfovibrio cuneatus TaxID=159728 RepID=UPI0004091C59|nr:acetyltransferase [Desulfovibrio cuneatus]
MLERIWIIGGGGFAAECHMYLSERMKYEPGIVFGGFLATSHMLGQYGLEGLFKGHYNDHVFEPHDSIILGIGNAEVRNTLFYEFVARRVNFYTLIALSAQVSPQASIGRGNVFCPHVCISPGVTIGDGNIFNIATIIGHDASVGNFNVLSTHCAITGYAKMENENFFGIYAGMLPHSRIGSRCTIGAGSIVYKRLKDDVLAVGNPAMKV